ncbi:MAG TPA: rRNA maturation RNase YbeY [Clostridiales bacterium]|nr:rRNA maturation RNase YbeY [Clostridiales bacterium]
MVKHRINVSRTGRGLGLSKAYALIRRAACAALEAEGIRRPCEINVLLTDNEGIREFNRRYRNVDSPTDVLSFPFNEFLPGKFDPEGAERDLDTGYILLGDIVLSLEKARCQGEEFGHGPDREIAYLTAHSVLHLLGYDHTDEGEQKRLMRSREEYICEKIGLDR